MGIEIVVLRKSSKDKSLLYSLALRETSIIANRPAVTSDLVRFDALDRLSDTQHSEERVILTNFCS